MDKTTGRKIYDAIEEAFQNFTEEMGGEDGIAIILQEQRDGEFPFTAIVEVYDTFSVTCEEPDEYEIEISFVKRVNHGE